MTEQTFDTPDTNPVRRGEQLDWPRLAAYVREQLATGRQLENFDAAAEMQVEQFSGGHSNLTYLLRFGACEVVLRRPPFGPVPPRAHDMAREFRILAALHPVFPLAPRPYLLCEDAEVAGATFYLMERRRGLVVRGVEPPQLAENPPARRHASAALVETLVQLHGVDIGAHDLAALGKPAGFVTRQVGGWAQRWRGSQTSALPEMDQLALWLEEHLPPETERPALVHGDYKLDNVMLDAKSASRVVAVFDWEMSALGDPLVDLGILLCYWVHAAAPHMAGDSLASVTGHHGWYTREEIVEHYAARSGRDLRHLTFYEVFAVFKLAVVVQQIYFRYRRGQTDDPRFATLGERVAWLAQLAAEMIEVS